MSLLDAFAEFDAALEWQLDDQLLSDDPPVEPGEAWPQLPPAAVA